ncbi:hypothetical protein NONO_c67490 [Nocardia nova SH22a]|uniref:Uncharacterized protein n=2 Tax=Nocardia nova TaxID=37330 RepID=W5TWG4_9NOCA|nr:hypothetical protein NONO_c67490 [Nocardia nova SH22a]
MADRARRIEEGERNVDMFSTCWMEPLDLTPAKAHQIMQMHRGCRTDECPRRRAALRVLVEAGRLIPDSSRVH